METVYMFREIEGRELRIETTADQSPGLLSHGWMFAGQIPPNPEAWLRCEELPAERRILPPEVTLIPHVA